MSDTDSKKKQGKIIKVLFWCMVAPMMFFVFMRLFFVLFGILYTPLVSYMTGQPVDPVDQLLFILAALTALVFTIAIIGVIYKQLKKHIIDG